MKTPSVTMLEVGLFETERIKMFSFDHIGKSLTEKLTTIVSTRR